VWREGVHCTVANLLQSLSDAPNEGHDGGGVASRARSGASGSALAWRHLGRPELWGQANCRLHRRC
jgi:hypothetical protein